MKTKLFITVMAFVVLCVPSHAQEAKWFVVDHPIRSDDGLRVLRAGTACTQYPDGRVLLLASGEEIKDVKRAELGTQEEAQSVVAARKAAYEAARERAKLAEADAARKASLPVVSVPSATPDPNLAKNVKNIAAMYQREIESLQSQVAASKKSGSRRPHGLGPADQAEGSIENQQRQARIEELRRKIAAVER